MTELLYLLLGWLLGLLGPRVIDAIGNHYSRRSLAVAIRTESLGLQYRAAITSMQLAERFGDMSKEYLAWLRPKTLSYKCEENPDPITEMIDLLLITPDDTYEQVLQIRRAKAGTALGLQFFSSSLIDASLESLKDFPIDYQSLIHESRNQLSVLNHDVQTAIDYHRMTFDSSLSTQNYAIISADLHRKYGELQKVCMRVVDKLQLVIDFNVRNI